MTTLDLPLELNLDAVHFTDEQFYQSLGESVLPGFILDVSPFA